jgi:hypothetical protein
MLCWSGHGQPDRRLSYPSPIPPNDDARKFMFLETTDGVVRDAAIIEPAGSLERWGPGAIAPHRLFLNNSATNKDFLI